MTSWKIVVIGFGIHLVFFYSIFDIYFTSPLTHGMTPVLSNQNPPSKRLVLFVADGLRADKFFEVIQENRNKASFLRNVIEKEGAWGVSHTRVPTESRPGHVALIAGFYEDVSAVAKGWKENPVEFDSLFNQSRYTWSWGSPDILPMFAKGATGDHVKTFQYPSHLEDFAASDSSHLDTWVFDRVKEFLQSAADDDELKRKLHQDKLVFFLHLLGIDTNGHAHNPSSSEYLENIDLIDKGIQDIISHFENFYHHDNKTAYILSSDHGMTNWGSHGAGNPHETLTPLVAWGAGVRKPIISAGNDEKYKDNFHKDWKLENIIRHDVEQADIAPLMAALIGTFYPINSVGILPIAYLDASEETKAHMLLNNAMQILAQFQVKYEEKKSTTLSATFRPYKPLEPSTKRSIIREINQLLKSGQFNQTIHKTQDFIKSSLEGLNYYQKYDRFFLGVSIACGFMGWMVFILILVIKEHSGLIRVRTKLEIQNQLISDRFICLLFAVIAVIFVILLAVQHLPWTYYLYCLIPLGLWMKNTQHYYMLLYLKNISTSHQKLSCFLTVIFCAAGLEVLVTGFFYRELLSLGLVSMSLWPLCRPSLLKQSKVTVVCWLLSCLSLSVFPWLPVVGRDTNYSLVVLAGILGVVIALLYRQRAQSLLDLKSSLFPKQILLCVTSLCIVMYTSYSIKNNGGLPILCQICSWVILGTSPFIPLFSGTNVNERLMTIYLSFFPPYLLLSLSQEGLFIVNLCCLLFTWLNLETMSENEVQWKFKVKSSKFTSGISLLKQEQNVSLDNVRQSFFFVFLILTSFFGTGNIASINSFEPASVYCFVTVFNPFVMGFLMMIKNILPFILVMCTFRGIHVTTNLPITAQFMIVLIMSDFMGLNFFFLVRDYGSWLDIGTSISHYVIVMCMILFLLLLHELSYFLTSYTWPKLKTL